MKKLVLFAVVAVAISFTSCTNKANQDGAATTDTTTAVVVEEVVEEVVPVTSDSNAVDVVEAAPAVAPAK